MLGRTSKAKVVEREVSSAGARAVEAVGDAASELAERAFAAAQSAQRAATPVIRSAAERSAPVLRNAAEKSAESLSHAAERAAVVLADTAERLAESGEDRAAQAGVLARHRIADVSESLAKAVRPKKRRRFRKLLAAVLVTGGLVALVRSPLKSKLADRLFGAPPEFDDDEPESITLPSSASTAEATPTEPSEAAPTSEGAAPDQNSSGETSGVGSQTAHDEASQS